jgi:hypothetical protein
MQDQSREPEHEGCEQRRRVVSQTGSCVNQCSEPSSPANVLFGTRECSTAVRSLFLARPKGVIAVLVKETAIRVNFYQVILDLKYWNVRRHLPHLLQRGFYF